MVDLWIMYDASQCIRHGWVNRNRVLHPGCGWQYVVAPVKKHRLRTPIHQIELAPGADCRTGLFRQLEHYRTDAPHYAAVVSLLKDAPAETDHRLARLNTRPIQRLRQGLGITTTIRVLSEMNLPIRPVQSTEELALAICWAVGATQYINRPGGAAQFREEAFATSGVKLTIQHFTNMTYACGRFRFQPDMSIVDVMLWNSPDQIRSCLTNAPWRAGPRQGSQP